MLQFRDFKEGDENQLIPLVLELKKYYPNIETWLSGQIDKIKRKEVECLLIDANGEIAGCAISGIESQGISTVKLKTFYIKEKYKGHSFGPYLLNRLLDFWTEKGLTKIFVTFAEEEVELLLDYFKEYGFLLDGVFPFNYRTDKSEYYMSKINIYKSLDKNQFQDFVMNYLFRLRGYKIIGTNSWHFIVQKHIYIKEAYRTLVYVNTDKNQTINSVLSKVKELIRDSNCSTGIIVSYYPLESANERFIKVIDNYDIETIFFPINLIKDEYAASFLQYKNNMLIGYYMMDSKHNYH
ncbi:MAG: GNAT family N-acetyltransferase [Nanoarchaeota archaeon]